MKKLFAFAAIIGALVPIGCHGQVPTPSTPPTVGLTCTTPAGFIAGSGNGFVFARAVCTSTTTCPANTAGNTAFTALNAATPSATCSFTDSTPPNGSLVVYTVSTIQGTCNGGPCTSQPSAPSNNGTALAIPVMPLAPSALGATQSAELVKPNIIPTQKQELAKAMNSPLELTARVIR